MKTKKLVVAVLALALVFFVIGCGGQRHAVLKTEKGEPITHDDWNASLFQKSVDPQDLAQANRINAEAYRIKQQGDAIRLMAEAEAEMMKNYSKGEKEGAGKITPKYCVVATNLTNKVAYVYHPEFGRDYILGANNGYKFLYLSSLPDRMIFKNEQGRIVWEPRPDMEKIKHKKIFLGREVDLKFNLRYQ